MRECGLKYEHGPVLRQLALVTPFAGVWIEIEDTGHHYSANSVTPFAGVWIEIQADRPLRMLSSVTPFAGVWIEIIQYQDEEKGLARHSLCGSVD